VVVDFSRSVCSSASLFSKMDGKKEEAGDLLLLRLIYRANLL